MQEMRMDMDATNRKSEGLPGVQEL